MPSAFLSDLTGNLGTMADKQKPGAVNPYVAEGEQNQGAQGVIYGKRYVPKLTPRSNVTAQKLVTEECLVTRIGPNVCVSGTIKAGSTKALNTETKFLMDLPIPSDFKVTLDLSGCGARSGFGLVQPNTSAVMIKGDVEGNQAEFIFNSTSADLQDITFIFQYGII